MQHYVTSDKSPFCALTITLVCSESVDERKARSLIVDSGLIPPTDTHHTYVALHSVCGSFFSPHWQIHYDRAKVS